MMRISPTHLDPRLVALLRRSDSASPRWVLAGVLALTLLVAAGDYVTGWEVSFSIFYVAPVAIAAWFLGRRHAWVMALLSALLWMQVNHYSGERYSSPLIPYWNAFVRFWFYVITAEVLLKLRETLTSLRTVISQLEMTAARELEVSRSDALTGARNARAFYEAAAAELQRSLRYDRPMSLAYLDADGFKSVNDTHGHAEGDRVLREVAWTLTDNLRGSDVVARLGGDEFGLLLPETDEIALFIALEKVQNALRDAMLARKWTVSFSIGAVSCLPGRDTTVAEIVHAADRLMYEVKRQGKNSLRIGSLSGIAV